MKNDWRNALSNIKEQLPEGEPETEVVPKQEQKKVQREPLRVELDKRNGKPATLVTEFLGNDNELKDLAKILKVKCGAGGSSRDGEILVQGDFRVKISEVLISMGYKVKKINFK